MDAATAMDMAERLVEEKLNTRVKDGWFWEVKFNNTKRIIAQCVTKKREIRLSKPFMERMKRVNVKNTILHEIAHAIDFHQRGYSAHDYRWKKIASTLGAHPRASAKLSPEEQPYFKYDAICPNHGKLPSGFQRRPKREYLCAKCDQPIQLKQNY